MESFASFIFTVDMENQFSDIFQIMLKFNRSYKGEEFRFVVFFLIYKYQT